MWCLHYKYCWTDVDISLDGCIIKSDIRLQQLLQQNNNKCKKQQINDKQVKGMMLTQMVAAYRSIC
jgi:non-homologous end joining protein Ku